MSAMNDNAIDPELSPAQMELVSKLSAADLVLIDEALMSQVSREWRKVARVVGTAMLSMPTRPHGVPDVFFAQRVSLLVDAGRLESQGDLRQMRSGEVRLSAA